MQVGLDIQKAKDNGANDLEILDHLKSLNTNIDWEILDRASKNAGVSQIDFLKNNQDKWHINIDPNMLKEEPQNINAQDLNTPDLQTIDFKEERPTQEPKEHTWLDRKANEIREALGFGISEDEFKYRSDLLRSADEKIKNGEELNKEEKYELLRNNDHTVSYDDPEIKSKKDLKEKYELLQEKALQNAISTRKYEQELVAKGIDKLEKEDIDYIKSKRGSFDSLIDKFRDDKEIAKDYIENKKAKEIIAPKVKEALSFLDRVDSTKSLATLFLKSTEEEKQKYMQSVYTIAEANGFDDIGIDKSGDVYFFKDNKAYRANGDWLDGLKNTLKDSAFSIAGGIGGAMRGARAGLPAAIIGGAIGSALGAGVDTAIANTYLNREHNVKDYIRNALTDGTLSLVGDMALVGAVKLFKGAKNIGEYTRKAADYIPIIGSALRLKDGNYLAAKRLIDGTISKEDQELIKKFAKQYGGGLDFKDKTIKSSGNLPLGKFEELRKIFSQNSNTQKRDEIIRLLRADDGGTFNAYLSQSANANPEISKTLKNIFSQTTYKLKQSLENLGYNKQAINEVINQVENESKSAYDSVLNKLIDTYGDKKIKIDGTKFKEFKEALENDGVMDEKALSYLNFIEKSVYNPKGVSLEQLNNARKNINTLYKESPLAMQEYFKTKAESFIKEDIKDGMESIFKSKPELYQKAKTLFETTLQDYSNMKGLIKLTDELKLRDKAVSFENSFNRLFNYLKGKGEITQEGVKSNFKALTEHLNDEQKAKVEINILNALLERFSKDINGAEVFDSKSFLENIRHLDFQSKEAKDYINIIEGFDRLFKNDYKIAKELYSPSIRSPHSSIATTLSGALRFQAIRYLFSHVVRLMPHIPFLEGINKGIQSSALRYQIMQTLKNAKTVKDFSYKLENKTSSNHFNLKSKELLEDFIKQVDKHSDLAQQVAKEELLKSQEIARLELEKQTQAQNKAKEEFLKSYIYKLNQAGKAENEREIITGEPIKKEILNLPRTIISINDDTQIPLNYVRVKAEDIKPDFSGNGLQPRVEKNQNVIDNIAGRGDKEFDPNRIIGNGGYRDLPIINTDGAVIVGNHRAQGFKEFTPNAKEAYKKAIKEALKVDLADDELIVRMPSRELSNRELIDLAFASNNETTSNIGDKILASLGKYGKKIDEMLERGKLKFEADSLAEQQSMVARTLEPQNAFPDTEAANMALFAKIAPNSMRKNLSNTLNEAFRGLSAKEALKIKDMYIQNAGSFFNLITDLQRFPNLDFRPYFIDSIPATTRFSKLKRTDVLNGIKKNIDDIFSNTDSKGSNAILEASGDYSPYNDIISELLGESLARFVRMENPATRLYELLKKVPDSLEDLARGNLFTEGKGLDKVDIYDFLEHMLTMNIDGEIKEQTGILSQILEAFVELRKRHLAYEKNHREYKSNTLVKQTLETLDKTDKKASPLQDITFKDSKGKEHVINTQTQNKWIETFGLKDINDTYIPEQNKAIKEALDGKEIRLQIGSLKKLVAQGREQYIPQIKEVLENPEAILRDGENAFIFIRHLKDHNYFVNVSVDKGEYLVSISNGIKESNNIKNKLDKEAEVIYQSPNANSNLQTLLQTSPYSANRTDINNTTIKEQTLPETKTTEVKNQENTKDITFKDRYQQEKVVKNFDLKAHDESFIKEVENYIDRVDNRTKAYKTMLKNKARKLYNASQSLIRAVDKDGAISMFVDVIRGNKQRVIEALNKALQNKEIKLDNGRRADFRFDLEHTLDLDFYTGNSNKPKEQSKVIYDKGFKGGEVADRSDMLESSRTTTKPSDLQIEYPTNHSSGKNPQNDTTIKQQISQKQEELFIKAKEKFGFQNDQKTKDLLRWHKDSHKLTKDSDGLPRVFYHGSPADDIEIFIRGNDETGREGIYFSTSKDVAESYKIYDDNEVYKVFLKAKNPLVIDFKGNNYKSKYGFAKIKELEKSKKALDHDMVIFKNIRDESINGDGKLADTIIVFNPEQIKSIKNKGSYTDDNGFVIPTKPNEKATKTYFNEKSDNIYQSNPHLGSGLFTGSILGVQEDDNTNISFNPEKFILGFLGGAIGSKALSDGYKIAKAKYYEKNFNKFIDDVNKNKNTLKPRFKITPELEREFRENKVKAHNELLNKLKISDRIYADYITLAQKHPEYFANPQEAKTITEYIAQNPSIAIKASKKGYELIFSKLKGGKGAFVLDLELKGGKHRVRSVHLMKNSQYKKKIFEAKKLGEPILQFSYVNPN